MDGRPVNAFQVDVMKDRVEMKGY